MLNGTPKFVALCTFCGLGLAASTPAPAGPGQVRQASPALTGELAGSYQLAPGRVIDLGMAIRAPDIAYVIVRAGSANSVTDTMVHEIGKSVREAGFTEADAQEAQAGSRRLFELTGASWDQFKAVADPLKARPWAKAAWVVQMTEKGWGRPWGALNAGFDPAATLAKVKLPVLWFLGDLDRNVPSEATAARLISAREASANPDFTVVRIASAGHSFLATKTGSGSEFPTLTHMAPGHWDRMEAWLREHRFSRP